jgi:DNA-binding transcriptional ArsR family regulator
MSTDAVPELRLDQLKALAHPLRVRLLKELRINGPATATLLGRRLGESSGSTSYHLRQLERHGFVEEAPDTGDGRERWWRPAFGGHRVEAAHYLDDPEQRAVLKTYEANVAEVFASLANEYLAHQDEWSRDWLEAVTMSDFRLRLTPKQLTRLIAVVEREVAKFERYDSPGAEYVSVLFQAFPRRVRPFTEDET